MIRLHNSLFFYFDLFVLTPGKFLGVFVYLIQNLIKINIDKFTMIHYLQPYANNLNIGKAYNESISLIPDDDWICITDQDTLKFPGFADRVSIIVRSLDKKTVVTCLTNRLRKDIKSVVTNMYEVRNISKHLNYSDNIWELHRDRLQPINICPGVCMIFHKSVWNHVKFKEDTVKFDTLWSKELLNAGYQIKLALGLYIFHLYRWGSEDPATFILHLTDRNKLKKTDI